MRRPTIPDKLRNTLMPDQVAFPVEDIGKIAELATEAREALVQKIIEEFGEERGAEALSAALAFLAASGMPEDVQHQSYAASMFNQIWSRWGPYQLHYRLTLSAEDGMHRAGGRAH